MSSISGFRPPLSIPQQQMNLSNSIAAKIKTLDGQIKRAQGAVDSQAKMMTVARFTPDGYKKAEAKLEQLKANLADLQAKRAKLHSAQFAIG